MHSSACQLQQDDATLVRRHREFVVGALDQLRRLLEFATFDHAVQQYRHRPLALSVPAPVQPVHRGLCIGGRFGDPATVEEDQCPHIGRLDVCEQRAALAGVSHRCVGGILRLAESARIKKGLHGEIDAWSL